MSLSTAPEAIANAIQHFRDGKVIRPSDSHYLDEVAVKRERESTIALIGSAPIVDITPIYESRAKVPDPAPWMVYEDTIMRPPWIDAVFAYQQADGAVVMLHTAFLDREHEPFDPAWLWQTMADTHTIDWTQVRWIAVVTIWIAHSTGSPVGGPYHVVHIAIGEDGVPIDITWSQVVEAVPIETWDTPMMLVLCALTFLNCRNVTIVEPKRPRPQRRRMERHSPGVIVSEIQVFPRGITVRGKRQEPGMGGVPLSTVRGHVARYGPQWGRGLLFGKYEGEFWIPAHARGDATHGTVEQHVTLHTDEAES